MHFESCAQTHIGRRSNNEDRFCHEPLLGLFAVADGVGGYEGGEIAAGLAIEQLREFVHRNERDPEGTWPCKGHRGQSHHENLLMAAAELAHQHIEQHREGRLAQMGSTLVALKLFSDRAVIAHVGDSRAYLLRGEVLDALTVDHSLYAQLQAGGLAPPRAEFGYRNIITRALGMEGAHHADVSTVELRPGDVLLLCSDGLHDPLSHQQLREVLLQAPSPASACQRLVDLALEENGSDNITVVVIKCVEALTPHLPTDRAS